MSHVLVLIANPARADLNDSIVGRVREAVAGGAPAWLAPGIAAEIAVAGPAALAAAQGALAGAKFDAAVLPQAGRRKRLLVADMESTLIENELLDDIAT